MSVLRHPISAYEFAEQRGKDRADKPLRKGRGMKERSTGIVWLQNLLLAIVGKALTVELATAAGEDAKEGARISIYCTYCHGSDGNPFYPGGARMAGQDKATLIAKMKAKRAFYLADRNIMMMVAFLTAGCLNDRDIENLATYFSEQTTRGGTRATSRSNTK